jgi:hypothetical protein
MGLLADLLAQQEAQQAEPTLGESFGAGLRSGGLAAGGQLATLGGSVLDSPELLATGRRLRGEAAAAAPVVGSLRDVHSLGDFGHYAAGLAGGMVPTAGAALGAGLLTRDPRKATLAGTAALSPLEVGDVLQRQEEAGQPLDLRTAVPAGVASAAVQNVLPGAARAAKIPGGALAAIPEQAALAGGSEAIKQQGAGQQLDPEAIKEAAAGGAVMGAPVAAVHGLSANKSKLKNLYEGARGKVDESLDRVSKGIPLGDLKEFGDAQGDKLNDLVKRSDELGVEKAKQWGQELLAKGGLTPEKQAELVQAMSNLHDDANRMLVAGMKKAQDLGSDALDHVNAFADHAKELWAGAKSKAAEAAGKKSEDYSGLRAAIADVIQNVAGPALRERHPELLNNPEAIDKLAGGMRYAAESLARDGHLDEKTTSLMHDFFGDDTRSVLEELHGVVANQKDQPATERYFKGLNEIADNERQGLQLREVVAKYAKDKDAAEVDAAVNNIRRILNGDTTKDLHGEQKAYEERRLMDLIHQEFGADTDKVLAAFEKDTKRAKYSAVGPAEDPELVKTLEQPGDQAALLNKGEPVESPQTHRANYDSESRAERMIREAEAKYPDVKARFLSHDEAVQHGLVDEGAQTPEGHGYVAAFKTAGSDKLTDAELSSMRFAHDKTNARSNPSLVDFGTGGYYDARKVTSVMHAKLGDQLPDAGTDVRLARAFMNGVGQLAEKTGEAPKLNDTIVIGQINGAPLTWGEAKKLTAVEGGRNYDAELQALRKQYSEARARRDERGMDETARKAQRVKDARDEEIAGREDRADKPVDESLREQGKQEADPDGQIHEAAAALSPNELERKNPVPSAKPTPADALRALDSKLKRMEASAVKAVRDAGAAARELAKQWKTLDDEQRQMLLSLVKQHDMTKAVALVKELTAPAKEVPASGPKALLDKARSPDSTFLERVAKNDDAKGLQRAVEELNRHDGTERAVDAINERLGQLVQDPDVAYSLQRTREGKSISPAKEAEVREHIEKVLGPQVRVETAKLAHAGDFHRVNGEDVIRVSTHALNPMSVAYHESLHGFFAQLRDAGLHEVTKPLLKAAESAHVMGQLRELLRKEPEALKQLENPEERVAYMYQFWANGKLTVGPAAKNVFQRVADMFRRVLGIWSNDERALHVMEYFQRGDFAKDAHDPSAAGRALLEPGRNAALEKVKAMTQPLARLADTLGTAGAARLRDTKVPALLELTDRMKGSLTGQNEDPGFLPAARIERTRVMNELGAKLSQFSKEALHEALEAMQAGAKPASTEAKAARLHVRKALDALFDYMSAAGVKVGDLGYGKDYFPRVYDPDFISRHQDEFRTLLEAHGVKDPTGVMARIMANDGSFLTIETPKPGMQHLKERVLAHIPDAQLRPFMRKDLFEIMNSYVTQAARRAEWARRFGDDGKGIQELLARAKEEGASAEQLKTADDFIHAIDGTLGDNLNPTARRLFGNAIVYQNIRLLPLAIFSSVVDPLGIVVRGGTVGDAWSTFKRGVRETVKNFKSAPDKDAATELAETMGVVDNAALVHTLGALYSQGMVGDTARKINDTFFRFNLMEQFNISMRVGATEAALKFIARHAGGESEHSARYMAELGLEKSDVKLDDAGRPVINDKVRLAANKWVDGAVLRPDAADKPIWMSDPHWALIAHLKQFVYSFHETILKRVVHEYQHGNYKPAMAMAAYVPVMIASDLVKGLIQGGGQQPDWKDKWGAEDYLWSGVQRAGLLGSGQFLADMAGDIKEGGVGVGALGGPTIEQFTDAVRVLEGREMFHSFALKSMPANALYATLAGGQATDPKFAD